MFSIRIRYINATIVNRKPYYIVLRELLNNDCSLFFTSCIFTDLQYAVSSKISFPKMSAKEVARGKLSRPR